VKSNTTHLRFPIGGLNKRLGYQWQSPYTTPSALNVWPDEAIAGRERGGSRPGLEKARSTQLGSGNPTRLLSEVRYVNSGTLTDLLIASANGVLYKDGGSSWTSITSGVTLASNRMLTAAEHLQKLYIAGDNNASRRLCVYDPSANTLALVTASAGTVPVKCTLVCRWNDRLVLAGDTDNPHLWYMSKQGDPTNWDYTVTNSVAAAVAASNSPAGRLGEPIQAIISHSDKCLIFGCRSSIYILRGDPLQGGSLDLLNDSVGIIGPAAWCYDRDGFLFMLTNDGVYVMPPGCGSNPSSVSREVLPEELLGITANPTEWEVCMAYDLRFRGVHLFCTNISNRANSVAYWIDTKTTLGGDNGGAASASFWPVSYQNDHNPTAIYSRKYDPLASTTDGGVLLGGYDGYTRRHDKTLAQDDGSNAISSHVDIGPFPLGPAGWEGLLTELDLVPAVDSGDIDIDVRVAQTAEGAYNASAFATYEFNTAGLNAKARPRARGAACVLRLKNGESNARWAMEELLVEREAAGPRRLA
jgi:hypothetical protein